VRQQAGRGSGEAANPAGREAKLAYLQGLAEGVEESEDSATASLLSGIVEVLGDLSQEVRQLREAQEDLAGDMEELAQEMDAGGEVVVDCPSCGAELAFDRQILEDGELELTCPSCGELVHTPDEEEGAAYGRSALSSTPSGRGGGGGEANRPLA
jgi:uncharacterized C2H2 Zn-finger protein